MLSTMEHGARTQSKDKTPALSRCFQVLGNTHFYCSFTRDGLDLRTSMHRSAQTLQKSLLVQGVTSTEYHPLFDGAGAD